MKNEEPNQIKCYCGHTTMCDCSTIEEPKQETLEEAAHKMLMDFGIMSVGESINALNVKKLMVLFAKEQQKRSYSEEDLRKAWEDGRNNVITVGKPPFVITKFQHNSFSNWFEKFKKK